MTGPVHDDPSTVRILVDLHLLSPRERAVLEALSSGLTNEGIAAGLRISASTVKWHLKNIYRKLGVRSRSEAVCRLRQDGLADPNGAPRGHAAAIRFPDSACPIAVVEGLAAGRSNKLLARQLFVSRSTIKFHLKKLYRRLGTSNRIEAIRLLRDGARPAREGGQRPPPASTAASHRRASSSCRSDPGAEGDTHFTGGSDGWCA